MLLVNIFHIYSHISLFYKLGGRKMVQREGKKRRGKEQFKKRSFRDFPGGPVVKPLRFQCQYLVGELRSHMPRYVAKR